MAGPYVITACWIKIGCSVHESNILQLVVEYWLKRVWRISDLWNPKFSVESSGGDLCWRLRGRREGRGAQGVGWKNFRFLSSKRRVLVHSGCYFRSWIEWKLVRLLSGVNWLVSFGGHKACRPLSEYWGGHVPLIPRNRRPWCGHPCPKWHLIKFNDDPISFSIVKCCKLQPRWTRNFSAPLHSSVLTHSINNRKNHQHNSVQLSRAYYYIRHGEMRILRISRPTTSTETEKIR